MTVFCRKNHSKRKSATRNQSQKKSASNNTNETKKIKRKDQAITKNTPIKMLPEELVDTGAHAEEEEMIVEESAEEVLEFTTKIESKKIMSIKEKKDHHSLKDKKELNEQNNLKESVRVVEEIMRIEQNV